MKVKIELTDEELKNAVYNYLIDTDAITDDMEITDFYPCSKVIELTNELKMNVVGEEDNGEN
jgi:hypothetical protein